MASKDDDSGGGGFWGRLFGSADEAEPETAEDVDPDEGSGFLSDSFDALTGALDSASEAAESALKEIAESDPDHDGITTAEELKRGSDPSKADSDLDGLPDREEYRIGSDPMDPADPSEIAGRFFGGIPPESDDEGFFDDPLGTIAEVADAMTGGVAGRLGDAIKEVGDADPDGDGVPTATEIRIGTDPNVPEDFQDTDGDHLEDDIEVMIGTDPGSWDSDGDGLSDFQEVMHTDTDPTQRDTDRDGVSDRDEVTFGTDPLTPPSGPGRLFSSSRSERSASSRRSPDVTVDSDAESDVGDDDFEIPSGDISSQSQDDDFDGVPNDMDTMAAEFPSRNTGDLIDADRDGLTDVAEAKLGTDPNNRDTDGDKIPDLIEVRLGTDPLTADPIPAEFADEGPSDGTEEGDLFEGMGKVEMILREREAAAELALAEEEAAAQDPVQAQTPTLHEGEDTAVVETEESSTDGDFEDDDFDDDFEIEKGDPFSQSHDDDLDGITNDMEEVGVLFAVKGDDADSDGLTDVAEARLGTDPENRDTDGDKMPDLVEVRLGTDPLVADAMPAEFADDGFESDGTERGDGLEGMGKVEGILNERNRALLDAEEGLQASTDSQVPALDEAIAELSQQEDPVPEVVVEEAPPALEEEPVDTFDRIDASVDSLLIETDDIDGE